MKFVKRVVYTAVILFVFSMEVFAAGFVIDHTSTDLSQIPDEWIIAAKANIQIAYNHTSHGSQLITGMNALENFPAFGDKYSWTSTESVNASTLCLRDRGISGTPDLSQGDTDPDNNGIDTWAENTFDYLTAKDDQDNYVHNTINVIMWSWCNIGGHNIPRYLHSMDWLIDQFSEGGTDDRALTHPVTFVYMTGHANGGGEGDSSDICNQAIRQHCSENDRILFDFSDIENYDPDGNYFLDKLLNDTLAYASTGVLPRDANWASEYLDRHPGSELDQLTSQCSSCAHSDGGNNDARLNCILKARAVWALFARLAGWGECTQVPTNLAAVPDVSIPEQINVDLTWTDNSFEEDSYIVQKRISGGSWSVLDTLAVDSESYTDTDVAAGNYDYRVLAHKAVGNNAPCDSASSIQAVVVVSPIPPVAPSDLALIVDSQNSTVTLSWQDNSNNETGFRIWRKLSSQIWSEVASPIDQVNQDFTGYIDTSVAPGSYTYSVEAYNPYGNAQTIEEKEAIVEDVPLPPSLLEAAADSQAGQIVLTWQDNSDNEDGFVVQIDDSGTWQNHTTVGSDVVTYTHTSLGYGTYTYRVYAFTNSVGDSLASNNATGVISSLIPLAPTNFSAVLSGFDVELTWQDNSDNEESFIVYQSIDNGPFEIIGTCGPNVESHKMQSLLPYHDYSFYVLAHNSNGDSDPSGTDDVYVAQEQFTIRLEDNDPNEVDDAFLNSSSPDTPYGGTRYSANFERFLIKFNLPECVMNKHIISAKFSVYVWSTSSTAGIDPRGQRFDIFNVTQGWSEDTVTWNFPWPASAAGGSPGAKVGQLVFHNTADNHYDHEFLDEVELKGIVQNWADEIIVNNGIVFDSNGFDFGLKASEYNPSKRSYLEITYANKPDCTTDYNQDSDVDGKDLAEFINQFSIDCLDDIAFLFGQ